MRKCKRKYGEKCKRRDKMRRHFNKKCRAWDKNVISESLIAALEAFKDTGILAPALKSWCGRVVWSC